MTTMQTCYAGVVMHGMIAVSLCLEVESLIVTLQRGIIRGYEMAEPYTEAMVPVASTGLIDFHTCLQLF